MQGLTQAYSHIINQSEERVNDCIAEVVLRSPKNQMPSQENNTGKIVQL